MATRSTKPLRSEEVDQLYVKLGCAGYKSIMPYQEIEVRPLTLLAGANSSGKSSIMQTLLLLKQTLEASYDPGPLLLDGPNVRFTSADQLLSYAGGHRRSVFEIGVALSAKHNIKTAFQKSGNQRIKIRQMTHNRGNRRDLLRPNMDFDDIWSVVASELGEDMPDIKKRLRILEPRVVRSRCFLDFGIALEKGYEIPMMTWGDDFFVSGISESVRKVRSFVRQVIHVPGLRGNPERLYPVTAVESVFPGTFENYTASVVAAWQSQNAPELARVREEMSRLGLNDGLFARRINDAQVELMVARVKGGSRDDMVNIADVGFGVSQTLPVLVALNVARQGQLVYLEQPEIHLHPRAQVALAQSLVDAAGRGVLVVAETHSSLLLLSVQTLVAERKLDPKIVKLHWFRRGNNGLTTIASHDIDRHGSFGDWPEDFSDVELEAGRRFLNASECQ